MAEKIKIDLLELAILPLTNKKMLKGAFPVNDSEFQHLISWLKTLAWISQREKKSKTYLAFYKKELVGYITISLGIFEHKINGIENTTRFGQEVLLIGKFYVAPSYRRSGIGHKLLSFVLDIARNIEEMVGCLGLIVDSNDNQDTIKFYQKFGFIPIDEMDIETKTIKMFFQLHV